MHAIQMSELPHYSYDDYKKWEGRWEVISGIPHAMSPAPTIKHQNISNNIAWLLKEKLSHCEHCIALLPVDWKITDDTVVQPDNLVICHQAENEKYITKAPEIIFEVLSKSTAAKDQNIKFKLYESEGVKYYIMVSPEEQNAKVFSLNSGKYIKLADVSDETIHFKIKQCQFDFDFSRIWS